MRTLRALIFVTGFLSLANGYSKIPGLKKFPRPVEELVREAAAEWGSPAPGRTAWPVPRVTDSHLMQRWYHKPEGGKMMAEVHQWSLMGRGLNDWEHNSAGMGNIGPNSAEMGFNAPNSAEMGFSGPNSAEMGFNAPNSAEMGFNGPNSAGMGYTEPNSAWMDDGGHSSAGMGGREQNSAGMGNSEQRIVGGRDVSDGEIPWQVSLQRKSMNNGKIYHICGGSIINKEWVVTAAHCVALALLSNYRIVSATTDLRDENRIKSFSSSDYFIHKVVDVHIHDEYDMFRFRNDIALIRVDPPFEFGNKVQAIALPSSGHQAHGHAYASGWGLMQEGVRITPSKLQAVSLPIVSDDECRGAYGDNLAETMICAGYKEGGKSVCQGDSGGPLFQKSGGHDVLIGVVSWGVGCARPGKPGVYTEVSHYIDWIDRTTGGGGSYRRSGAINMMH